MRMPTIIKLTPKCPDCSAELEREWIGDPITNELIEIKGTCKTCNKVFNLCLSMRGVSPCMFILNHEGDHKDDGGYSFKDKK